MYEGCINKVDDSKIIVEADIVDKKFEIEFFALEAKLAFPS